MKAEFNVTGVSGVIGVGLVANSVLFSLRVPTTLANGDTNLRGIRLKRLLAKWRTIAGFTQQQEVSAGAFEVANLIIPSTDYAGGTDITDTIRKYGPDPGPKPLQTTFFQPGCIRICTNTGLTAIGSPTIASQPFAYDGANELDNGANTTRGQYTITFAPTSEGTDAHKGLLFQPGTGLIVRNLVAHGAGGTGRLFVDVVWAEQ